MTKPTLPGPNESLGVEQRMEKAVVDLDSWSASLGIPASLTDDVENEARRLLDLSPDLLRKMSGTDCGEAAFMLERFALHVQDACNREIARVNWAEASIRRIIAVKLPEQRGYSFDERRLLAVRENDAATKLDTLRVKAQLRVDRISYLAGKVEAMARAMLSLQQSKRGRNE